MEDDQKNAFYVVRKGDNLGIYKNLGDCQDQAGSSLTDPSISVYKGNCLPKATEDYLKSHGLKDAVYTIPVASVKDDTFGQLVPCKFQPPPQPSLSGGRNPQQPSHVGGSQPQQRSPHEGVEPKKENPPRRPQEDFKDDANPQYVDYLASMSVQLNLQGRSLKSEVSDGPSNDSSLWCTLEFDGISKGNPGLAGAGAVLRAEDGSRVYLLREGVGIATNNEAEYRGLILGLQHAIRERYKKIHVKGDSKLVCSQVRGLIKPENMGDLWKVANELKAKFTCVQVTHVHRGLNSEADAQAKLALNLEDGQIEVECSGGFGPSHANVILLD